MRAVDEQNTKAAAMRLAARAEPGSLLDVLEEALSFVSRHSESWYYSGQELCGKLEGKIDELKGGNDGTRT